MLARAVIVGFHGLALGLLSARAMNIFWICLRRSLKVSNTLMFLYVVEPR